MDLGRLTSAMGSRFLPTCSDWEKMDVAAAELDLRVEMAPDFQMKTILAKVFDADSKTIGLADKTADLKTEEEKELTNLWYSKIRTWTALKRIRCPVESGEPEAKRRRL
jgi:hypothetical protein